MEDLEKLLNYEFNDQALLTQALTHLSGQNEENHNYERLEFLGDAFINLVIADYLFGIYPDYAEGKLTQMKSSIVNGKTMSKLGRKLGLDSYVITDKGLRKKGLPDSICCDVVEAICAAVFLDAGIRFARNFVIDLFREEIMTASSMTKDSKSRLQEHVQQLSNERPKYDIIDVAGADHDKTFSATVTVCGILFGPCEGKTKKESEQEAALLALTALTK